MAPYRVSRLSPLDEIIGDGLGQLTRVFGTTPVPPAAAARALGQLQAKIIAASRFGIPAIAHEEWLTGFTAWTATVVPTPLAWGASFDPDLGRREFTDVILPPFEMAVRIGGARAVMPSYADVDGRRGRRLPAAARLLRPVRLGADPADRPGA